MKSVDGQQLFHDATLLHDDNLHVFMQGYNSVMCHSVIAVIAATCRGSIICIYLALDLSVSIPSVAKCTDDLDTLIV